MSLIADRVRKLDIQIDRFQLATGSLSSHAAAASDGSSQQTAENVTSRSANLRSVSRALSTSTSSPLMKRRKVKDLLARTRQGEGHDAAFVEASGQDLDLEWLILAKGAAQVYGMIMSTLLNHTIPLSDDLWYWDEVLGSYVNTGLYTIQTSPIHLWAQAQEVYSDAKTKYKSRKSLQESSQQASESFSAGWQQFYHLVQESIRDRSLSQAGSRILSPFALRRTEARKKQNGIKRLREMNATGLGLLIDEALSFGVPEDDTATKAGDSPKPDPDEWRSIVAKSISFMESILRNVNTLDAGVADFEEGVFTSVDEDPEIVSTSSEGNGGSMRPGQLTDRLLLILTEHLPGQEQRSSALAKNYGRPSMLIRYWPAGVLTLVFGGTILRFLANRRAEIREWIQDFGQTVVDFWANWIIDPVKKLVGTIRHDEASEVAIMSKDSLRADRESLERMVVDFAADRPDNETGARYTESQIQMIQSKVKEGDLTPVLKAYERDLRKPFMGTIRGDLVRALLIQVQKTKVDVEVAIGGIDSLLKSQELVFGLVGLTPGLLIAFATFRWLGGIFGSRKGLLISKKKGLTVRLIRNIDRILSSSTPTQNGTLSYKDHGLLLCEVHVLRQRTMAVLPGEIHREFLEDMNDLLDIRYGIPRQVKVLERIRWAYARWLR